MKYIKGGIGVLKFQIHSFSLHGLLALIACIFGFKIPMHLIITNSTYLLQNAQYPNILFVDIFCAYMLISPILYFILSIFDLFSRWKFSRNNSIPFMPISYFLWTIVLPFKSISMFGKTLLDSSYLDLEGMEKVIEWLGLIWGFLLSAMMFIFIISGLVILVS